jgi:hypothetical protein
MRCILLLQLLAKRSILFCKHMIVVEEVISSLLVGFLGDLIIEVELVARL